MSPGTPTFEPSYRIYTYPPTSRTKNDLLVLPYKKNDLKCNSPLVFEHVSFEDREMSLKHKSLSSRPTFDRNDISGSESIERMQRAPTVRVENMCNFWSKLTGIPTSNLRERHVFQEKAGKALKNGSRSRHILGA